jgi:hypothetical protein
MQIGCGSIRRLQDIAVLTCEHNIRYCYCFRQWLISSKKNYFYLFHETEDPERWHCSSFFARKDTRNETSVHQTYRNEYRRGDLGISFGDKPNSIRIWSIIYILLITKFNLKVLEHIL